MRIYILALTLVNCVTTITPADRSPVRSHSIQDLINYDRLPEPDRVGSLDLSNKRLTSLVGFNKIPNLDKLRDIQLQDNLLETLEGLPAALPNVERIMLSRNKLRTLDYFPTDLPKLKEIRLNNNPVTMIKDQMNTLKERLPTGTAVIAEFPEEKKLRREALKQAYFLTGHYPEGTTDEILDEYDVGYSIQELLDHGRLPVISNNGALNLVNKRINSLVGFENIPDLENLQYLSLDHNQLSSLQGMPTHLPKLQWLYLNGNPIGITHEKAEKIRKQLIAGQFEWENQ